MRLRGHHLLCIQFFEGHGYDDGFSSNMRKIVDRIRCDGSLSIVLVMDCDDICEHCPDKVGDLCRHGDSVAKKDDSVAKFLELPHEGETTAGELMTLAAEKIKGLTDVGEVCGECYWSSICNRILEKKRSGR
ncbi:MAG: DUF1284 domain-containing protein [Euryarchaeota archaeon]|nr:DUF1284 domain-containing protein [Euryarchaeota archaeon]